MNIRFNFIEDGGTAEGIPGGTGELYVNGEKVDEACMPEMNIPASRSPPPRGSLASDNVERERGDRR